MLKLKDFVLEGHILTMTLLVECKEELAFRMSVDTNTEWFTVVSTEVPDEYKMYERQASVALHTRRDEPLPETITSSWV